MTHVEVFEVPPDADAEFLADWRASDRPGVLYRALRDDVEFRFVELGAGDVPDSEAGCVLIEPFASPRARTSASSPPGSVGARRSRAGAATSAPTCCARPATSASSASPAGRVR